MGCGKKNPENGCKRRVDTIESPEEHRTERRAFLPATPIFFMHLLILKYHIYPLVKVKILDISPFHFIFASHLPFFLWVLAPPFPSVSFSTTLTLAVPYVFLYLHLLRLFAPVVRAFLSLVSLCTYFSLDFSCTSLWRWWRMIRADEESEGTIMVPCNFPIRKTTFRIEYFRWYFHI